MKNILAIRLSDCLRASCLATFSLVGTAYCSLLTEVATIDHASTLDFESVAAPDTTITATDVVFTDFGISQVSAVAANGSDKQNQTGQSGNALFANATQLMILPQGDNTSTFGTTTSFTLDFAEKHSNFGVSFQDQVGSTFTLELFNGGTSIGSIDKVISTVQDTLFQINSTDAFDRVVISGGAGGNDGWGIDNIKLVDSVREITSADFFNSTGTYTTIDFESVAAPTTISGVDTLFTDVGLQVSATGGSASGDYSSVNNANDQALYFNGSNFLVLPDANQPGFNRTDPEWLFGSGQVFTLDFALAQKRLGLVFGDQGAGDFQYNFYRNGQLQASYVDAVPNVNANMLYYETDFLFDRVVIDALSNDGFGIDNLTFAVVPEPSSALLVTVLLTSLTLVRRPRRVKISSIG